MAGRGTQKLHALTSLRFIAAGCVVVDHCAGQFGLPPSLTCGERLPLGLAVSFFFILSGFILTHVYPSLETPAACGRFLWGRFTRLWPCHAFAYLLAILAMRANGSDPAWFWRDGRALANLATLGMVHSWVPLNSYYFAFNPPSWSVSTVFGFCLLYPLLARRLDRTWPIKLGLCLLMSLALLCVCHRTELPYEANSGVTANGLLFMNPLARVFEFCLGMATASLWRQHGEKLRLGRPGGTALELATIAAFCANAYYWSDLADGLLSRLGLHQPLRVWFFHGTTCLSSAALVFVSAMGRGWVTRALSWRAFVSLGDVSYTANLLHIPLLICVAGNAEALAAYPHWATFSAYLIAVLAASFATRNFIEIPTRRLLMGRRDRPSITPDAQAMRGMHRPASAIRDRRPVAASEN